MGRDRPSVGRGPGIDADPDGGRETGLEAVDGRATSVAVTRTARGWTGVSPPAAHPVGDLVEGLSLADLVAEEFGVLPEPDRTARRSARGSVAEVPEDADPRVTALERTVAQLEHALAARVSTERAIGVLAERHGTTPRSAFESLRREARSQGRPVHELAREVLESLPSEDRPDAVVLTVAPPSSPARAPKAAEGRR